MDYATMFNEAINWLLIFLAGSGGTWLCVELVKWLPNKIVPISEGQKVRIRTAAAFISALMVGVTAYTSGALQPEQLSDILMTLTVMVGAWGGSHAIHTQVTKLTS